MAVQEQQFVDAIAEDPTALDRWDVYADWLLERGELRGELISLELATEAGRGSDEIASRITSLKYYTQHLVTPRLLEELRHWKLDWRRGFVRGASALGRPTLEAVDALLGDPHVVLLERLELGRGATPAVFELLVRSTRRSLRELDSAIVIGDKLGERLPALERLVTTTLSCSAPLVHRGLRELVVGICHGAGLRSTEHDLPALERLAIDVDLLAFFATQSLVTRPPARLACLAIGEEPMLDVPGDATQAQVIAMLEQRAEAVAERLARTPLAAQLRSLEILHGAFNVGALFARAAAFPRLERLALHGVGRKLKVIAALREQCAAAFPGVVIEIDELRSAEPPRPPKVVDADSRGRDGFVDAIAMYTQLGRERRNR